MIMKEETTMLCVRIPRDLARELKLLSVNLGTSQQELVRGFVVALLAAGRQRATGREEVQP